ncbi:hypothetical protein [Nostoc sp. UHCC 0252]|nr:hypothetical protein [Nostoc sp. UHCC 0252]MEA5603757.1 hypothetical protein [Nostoc sp. UHCC 0252]
MNIDIVNNLIKSLLANRQPEHIDPRLLKEVGDLSLANWVSDRYKR